MGFDIYLHIATCRCSIEFCVARHLADVILSSSFEWFRCTRGLRVRKGSDEYDRLEVER